MRSFIIYCLLFLGNASLLAQKEDLYNYQNSLRFAQFLDQKGSHKMAILEWERLNLMKPGQDSIHWAMIRAYRLADSWDEGLQRFDDLYPQAAAYQSSQRLARELNQILFLQKDFARMQEFVSLHQKLEGEYVNTVQISLALRQRQYTEAHEKYQLQKLNEPELKALIDESFALKTKNKALAIAMSTLVPGSGKAYLGNWKDGLVSFLFIAGSAYGSYRGFSQQGISSAYGWIFGSISTGFYLGNLFGTAKAVNKYNRGVLEHYQSDVETYLYQRL